MRNDRGQLIPATPSDRFARVFAWYTRRLLRKRFHRVHATPQTRRLLAEFNSFDGPAVMCCTHSSWWDPLVALHFQREFLPQRQHFSPIDAQQLERFRFFRKLGLFGIDPQSPESLAEMATYIDGLHAANPRFTLGITPQGRFADPREPVLIRPGAAAMAARLLGVRVLAAAVEYVLWQDSKPAVFLHTAEVESPRHISTAAWHRAIQSGMQEAASELASRVIARDPLAFEVILGPGNGAATDVNPAHGLWLRLRGRRGEIAARRASPVPLAGGGTN